MNDELQSYVPAHLAIEAMRDNGYKNTAYAVCELIDNSLQAEADHVQLLCAEKEDEFASRKTKRIYKIAVLDNGVGMEKDVLKIALQFGNGTRLEDSNRDGIGKFGMGLPASSISQCKRVDVWSWQNGHENAIHTYLDIQEIKDRKRTIVPDPERKEIPNVWLKAAANVGQTGTLIVWSKLDRLIWSKAKTIIENSENLIGRIYREFLNDGDKIISLKAFSINKPEELTIDRDARPNDPGYLMKLTSCPAPFDAVPLFEPFGENYEVRYTIDFQGQSHEVTIRLSMAKHEARYNDSIGGSTAYGRHAQKNIGISVVRARRELDLDQSQVLQSDTRERWWGIEVEFPPSLDELMGVTNNKQAARNFADILNFDIEDLLKSGKSLDLIKSELEEDGDPRAPLIEVSLFIKRQLKVMRELIKAQGKGRGGSNSKRYENTPEKMATELTQKRKDEGFVGTSDEDEKNTPEIKEEDLKKELIDTGVVEEQAEELAAKTIKNNLKYSFSEASLETDAFFAVRPKGGSINIILNTRHPAYDNFLEVLERDSHENNINELTDRLEIASNGLKLLLMAWARYEDELLDGPLKEKAQEARTDWGRVAKRFLANSNT
ncbi:ATP-binding protein [Paenibacillus sp. FSL H7-0942]|uniref:ATP-binding protein n=1 Tax=Paenibacillus sp. FSL H7-0942 TaxID=2921444 RepID=UPI003249623C